LIIIFGLIGKFRLVLNKNPSISEGAFSLTRPGTLFNIGKRGGDYSGYIIGAPI